MAEPADEGQAPEPSPVPPDPDAYDSPRAVQARARGLAAPYIAGGEDPDMATTKQRERRYLRLLVAMVVVVVLAGFVLGAIAKLVEDALAGQAPGATMVWRLEYASPGTGSTATFLYDDETGRELMRGYGTSS
ncbi:MAG TPA: hypothetical protein VL749_11310 [Patescibacteria group bacterium]|nr:hypothetical protein [Patescibacteria group bacterium]